jgi:hypothetical protein
MKIAQASSTPSIDSIFISTGSKKSTNVHPDAKLHQLLYTSKQRLAHIGEFFPHPPPKQVVNDQDYAIGTSSIHTHVIPSPCILTHANISSTPIPSSHHDPHVYNPITISNTYTINTSAPDKKYNTPAARQGALLELDRNTDLIANRLLSHHVISTPNISNRPSHHPFIPLAKSSTPPSPSIT